MAVITITKDNFENEVLKSEKTVLLDFWATWCPPCRKLSPTVDKVAAEHPEIKVGKVNVDEQPELASRFGIVNIPTLYVMKGGRAAGKSVGLVPEESVLRLLGIA